MTEDQKKLYVERANDTIPAPNENIVGLYQHVARRLQDCVFHHLKNRYVKLYAENMLYRLTSLNLSAAT